MIQNYLADSLVKNYTAPSYPIFIALQNYLNSINSKKIMREVKPDIVSLVQRVGPQAQKFVLSQLFDSLDFPQCKEKPNSTYKVQLLVELVKEYSSNVNFLSYFPQVVAKIHKEHKISTFLSKLLLALKIPQFSQISIALALYLSDRNDFSQIGQEQLVKKLEELKKNNKGGEVPEKIVEQLLFQISRNPELNERLEEVYNYLLEVCQNTNRTNQIRIYNYFKGDWQFFAGENPIIQKPPAFSVKKVNYLRDLGPSATHQVETLKTLMAEIGNLNQEDIFQCLMMMAEQKGRYQTGIDKFVTDVIYANKKNIKNDELKKILGNQISNKKNFSNWNIDNFLTYCTQNIQNLKWQNVIGNFDRPKLVFQSEQHFYNLMKIIEKIKKIGQKWKIPEALYLKKWMNPASQAAFLIQLFKCKQPDCLQLQQIPNKRIQKSVRDEPVLQKQIWGFIDLVQLLFQVSEYRFMEIRELFDYSITKYPQLLLLTLSEIKPNKGQVLLDEIFSQLLPNYLHNHSANIKLLENLWEINQDLVISCICEIYKTQSKKQNSFNLSRVLDITQSIKDSLLPFTTWNDFQFSIPLAVIAGKRQFLNFQPWLIDRIEKLGNCFVKAILLYIDNNLVQQIKKISSQNHKDNILQKAQLNVQLLNKIFFTIMMKVKRDDMSPRNFEYLKRLFKDCSQYFPEIVEGNIPDQVEKQTQRQMNRIYKEQISVKEATQRWKKLKNSKKPEDQEQLASHLTFLCSQLTYHHSYPQKQLMITADLFVAIINANLIEKKVYQMFLHVIESHLAEDNQKYIFAIQVIEKIKAKLCHESWFCQNLINIDLIMKKNPELVEQLIKSIQPPKPLTLEKEKRLKQAIKLKNNPPPQPASIITVLPSNNIQEDDTTIPEIGLEANNGANLIKKMEINDYDILVTLDKTKKMSVNEKQAKMSKITIVLNTISMNNIEEKARQLQKILENPETIKLLSHNIVFKRISISQNNGAQIYSRLMEKLPQIEKATLNITYKILQKWFALTGKSVNDKKFNNFKNIGSWLGRITIGKGYPIPIHKLHLKQILITSFAKSNRLSMNVSIVLKILQFINMHQQIFRTTSPWLSRLIGTLSQIQQKIKDDQITKSQIKAFFKSIPIKVDSIPMPPTSYLNNNRIIISQLDKYIVVDEQLANYYGSINIDLKMIITRAVDDSIQQIVEPVIQRAVKIAKVTTKQLILKDFALEGNPQKFRESSYNIVKNMAGPLAHVTCRQPLKASMNRSLKSLLSQHIQDPSEIDNIIQKAIPDNLDFGCTLIKQAVIESAEDSIKKDSIINQAIEMRIKSTQNNQQFKDQIHLRDIPPVVPEQLRPKPGGLSPDEFFVYQEFKNERHYSNVQNNEFMPTIDKIIEVINEKSSPKNIKQLLTLDPSAKQSLMTKINTTLAKQSHEEADLTYYFQICENIAEMYNPKQTWAAFKQMADLKKKQTHLIIKRLVRDKYFPESALGQIDDSNQQQNKINDFFENWLETAHQKIEPYLRRLQQMFNVSQNQIKSFFYHSLLYAMQKVEESFINKLVYDTNYIEDYSKLIIISYKTIASNNCNLYLQHTLKAILQVFDKLMNQSSEISFQRPFFKLFTNLIGDVTRKQYDIDHEKVMIFYCVLAKQLHKIAPLQYPAFSYAWVQLISNKNLMPALLETELHWELYFKLLSSLLKFLREYVTQQNLYSQQHGEIYQNFYKGVLKLIIIIIHDFPDFLSSFSIWLCLLPGRRFVQLTNMIISAYPKDMKFEFPLRVNNQAELIEQAKKGGEPIYYHLQYNKKKYDQYINSDPRDETYRQKLEAEDDETLQIFILYLGQPNKNKLTKEQCERKIQDLLVHTKDNLKHRLITYYINLIRYPNTVTLLFIQLTFKIILKASTDASTRDALLMNILGRMGAESPQAWGLDYLAKQLVMQKNLLANLNVSKDILKML